MKKYYYQLLISLFFFGLSFQIHAENLIGGTLDFTHTSGNNFNIKANIFVDKGALATSPDLYPVSMKIRIFSKGANASLDVLIETITLTQTLKADNFPYDNIDCASSTSISTTKIIYEKDHVLNKSTYNNPLGYYLVWQDGPRNATKNANTTVGMTLYLEFPRLDTQDNSSPVFRLKKGVVACVNQPFPNIDLGADDADAADTRTYSLVNAYSGGGNPTAFAKQNFVAGPRNIFSLPYQTVPWLGSFSATSPITGISFSLNPSTGILTGTGAPTVPGKYLICVECKEFKNNVQIGVNRLDFEIIIEDCMSPKPKIYLSGNDPTVHEPFINICIGSYRIIETVNNANFTYVWKKDGVIISGANKSQLIVPYANFGKYTVTVTRTGSCAGTETSLDTDLLPRAGENVTLTVPDSTVCSNAVPIVLTINQNSTGNSFGRKWYRDDILIPNEFSQSYLVSVSGKYKVIVTDFTPAPAGFKCTYEAFKEIIITPVPTPTITIVTGKTAVCQGETVKLSVAPVEAGVTYQWVRNSADIAAATTKDYNVTSTGTYELRATSTVNTDCEVYAPAAINVAVNPFPTVTFDDITPLCNSKSAKVDLRNLVNPYDATLGKFTGTGVSGYEFDPSVSGYGSFPIKYKYKTAVGCGDSASKIAIVDLTPTVKLGNDITIFRGDTIRLKSVGSTGNKYIYDWTPATSLSSPNIPQPIATPDATTEYVVKVTSVFGKCTATDKILITVRSVLKIPSAFTPNSDTVNDTWAILDNSREFNDYPGIEVKIFNRWGGEIFYSIGSGAYQSKPFDGIQDGQRLPAGTYFYVIKPSPDVPSLTGYVTIVR